MTRRCPACGSANIFTGYFTLRPECPRCEMKVQRHEGQWSGDIGINTVVTFSLLFAVLLGGALVMGGSLNVWALGLAGAFTAFVFPVLFVPFAKAIWLTIDLWVTPLEPLEPGEPKGATGRGAPGR